MANPTGKIQWTKRGWFVNRIHFKKGVHSSITWSCRAKREFVVVIPPLRSRLSKGKVTVIRSVHGMASFPFSASTLPVGTEIRYLILLETATGEYAYVHGNSPPIIVIERATA